MDIEKLDTENRNLLDCMYNVSEEQNFKQIINLGFSSIYHNIFNLTSFTLQH